MSVAEVFDVAGVAVITGGANGFGLEIGRRCTGAAHAPFLCLTSEALLLSQRSPDGLLGAALAERVRVCDCRSRRYARGTAGHRRREA